MKVKDYVRTKDYQNIRSRIGKIIRQDGKYYYLDIDEDTQMVWEKDTILKSSPNIIDLIEVGDILVIKDFVDEACMIFTDIYLIQNEEQLLHIKNDLEKNKNKMVYSIVTKEIFSSIEYEVKQ